jgi:hypothetical protein
MNQNVRTTDAVTFATVNGQTIDADRTRSLNQSLNTTDEVVFDSITLTGHISVPFSSIEVNAGLGAGWISASLNPGIVEITRVAAAAGTSQVFLPSLAGVGLEFVANGRVFIIKASSSGIGWGGGSFNLVASTAQDGSSLEGSPIVMTNTDYVHVVATRTNGLRWLRIG